MFQGADVSCSTAQTFTFLSMRQMIAMPGHIYKKAIQFPFSFSPIASPAGVSNQTKNSDGFLGSQARSPPSIPSLPHGSCSEETSKKEAKETKPQNQAIHETSQFIESYYGSIVQCRYYLKCTVFRKKAFQTSWVKELDIFIRNKRSENLQVDYLETMALSCTSIPPEIHMEFGLDHVLHLQFSCPKASYSLSNGSLLISGQIEFLMVRLKIVEMELQFFVKEMVDFHGRTFTHQRILSQTQIMDGSPGSMDIIPFRFFISSDKASNLETKEQPLKSPTMVEMQKKFSARYYLNLVLTDDHNKKYYKQQEIVITR